MKTLKLYVVTLLKLGDSDLIQLKVIHTSQADAAELAVAHLGIFNQKQRLITVMEYDVNLTQETEPRIVNIRDDASITFESQTLSKWRDLRLAVDTETNAQIPRSGFGYQINWTRFSKSAIQKGKNLTLFISRPQAERQLRHLQSMRRTRVVSFEIVEVQITQRQFVLLERIAIETDLDSPIEMFEIPQYQQVSRSLKSAGIWYISELIVCTRAMLQMIDGIGKVRINSIEEKLAEMGLSLRK